MTTNYQDSYWQIHDKFFKEMFLYLAVVRSFIEQYLLPKIQETVNLDTITPIRTESVDLQFRVLFSDLIFELKTVSGDSIYLLFEHKSRPDKEIEMQLIKYMDTFELDYLKDHDNVKIPLTIIPVVVYHGSDKWNCETYNTRLANLKFIGLSSIPDEQIRGTAILRIVLLTLKYIRSEKLITKVDDIFELFKELKNDPDEKEYIRLFSFYVEHASREEIRGMLAQKIKHFFSDEELDSSELMKELEKKGKEKGINIGVDAAKLIMTTNKTDEEIAKETVLSIDKIREIRKRVNKD